MTLAAQTAPELPHGLAGSLEGVAHELGLLQTHSLRLQDACHASALGGGLDPIVIRELQGLDLISQRLGVLTSFVRDLIGALPYDQALDLGHALGAVTLHDLAERLGAHSVGVQAPAAAESATDGDFDLF
jgi:hypothetical protein